MRVYMLIGVIKFPNMVASVRQRERPEDIKYQAAFQAGTGCRYNNGVIFVQVKFGPAEPEVTRHASGRCRRRGSEKETVLEQVKERETNNSPELPARNSRPWHATECA